MQRPSYPHRPTPSESVGWGEHTITNTCVLCILLRGVCYKSGGCHPKYINAKIYIDDELYEKLQEFITERNILMGRQRHDRVLTTLFRFVDFIDILFRYR